MPDYAGGAHGRVTGHRTGPRRLPDRGTRGSESDSGLVTHPGRRRPARMEGDPARIQSKPYRSHDSCLSLSVLAQPRRCRLPCSLQSGDCRLASDSDLYQ